MLPHIGISFTATSSIIRHERHHFVNSRLKNSTDESLWHVKGRATKRSRIDSPSDFLISPSVIQASSLEVRNQSIFSLKWALISLLSKVGKQPVLSRSEADTYLVNHATFSGEGLQEREISSFFTLRRRKGIQSIPSRTK